MSNGNDLRVIGESELNRLRELAARTKPEPTSAPNLRLDIIKWLSPNGTAMGTITGAVILQTAKTISDFVIDGIVPSKSN